MKTQTISFRCPTDILEEMETLCDHNHMDRTTFIVQAVQSLMTSLAAQGVSVAQSTAAAAKNETDK